MTPAYAKHVYQKHLKETVAVKRIAGTGSSRMVNTYATKGRVYRGDRRELVGGIAQQDWIAILNAEPLVAAGLSTDVMIGDYVIDADGVEYSVTEVKPRRVKAVMIAFELTLRA